MLKQTLRIRIQNVQPRPHGHMCISDKNVLFVVRDMWQWGRGW